MEIIQRVRQSLLQIKIVSAYKRWLRIISAGALTLLLTLNGISSGRVFIPVNRPDIQTGIILTFTADADTYVKQSSPNTNYGNASALLVNGVSNPDVESLIRFTVTGISSTVQNARLRVYATTNGTKNGPAIYATSTSWIETDVTWNSRPDYTSGAVDNKGNININSWVEYDVTSLVGVDGTFSFVLAADSSDGVRFSSRQGNHPPELVITLSNAENTPGVT